MSTVFLMAQAQLASARPLHQSDDKSAVSRYVAHAQCTSARPCVHSNYRVAGLSSDKQRMLIAHQRDLQRRNHCVACFSKGMMHTYTIDERDHVQIQSSQHSSFIATLHSREAHAHKLCISLQCTTESKTTTFHNWWGRITGPKYDLQIMT